MPDNIHSVSDDTPVAMPIRNIISIVGAVAVSTWAYGGVIERLNKIETAAAITERQIEANSEFRVRWPRGEMGSLPADSRQDMLIEALERHMADLEEEVEENRDWINNFSPPDNVQDAVIRVQELQIRLRVLEAQLADLKKNET